MTEERYERSIRDILGHLVGLKVVDITQHDPPEFEETGEAYVCLMFEDGSTVTFPIGEKFSHTIGGEPDDEEEE